MVARNGIHASKPSTDAVLESLGWLIDNLQPVASRDLIAHLWGIRRYVIETAHSDGNECD